jgi:small subunit ribosomal protein S4
MLKGERCTSPKCPLEKGDHPSRRRQGSARRRRISERGWELKEKQKARISYGLMERQFKNLFTRAKEMPGTPGDNLLLLLERRLDNITYRLGFAISRREARQMVSHGHIFVNGRKLRFSSYMINEGDTISFQGDRELKIKEMESRFIPSWLSLDRENLTGKMVRYPEISEVGATFDTRLIVEYYSK